MAHDVDGWKEVMDREMDNLKLHSAYKPVLRVPGMRTLRLGWVLHFSTNSVLEKNKARLVARGNHQRTGVDYDDSFSPVICLESLHTLLALAAISDLDVIQFGTTPCYLYGALKEELYMEQRRGAWHPGREIGSGDSRRVSID